LIQQAPPSAAQLYAEFEPRVVVESHSSGEDLNEPPDLVSPVKDDEQSPAAATTGLGIQSPRK